MEKESVRFRHEYALQVRWGDMDAYGHVNNTLFFRYLECARFAYFEEVCGFEAKSMPMVVVVDLQCHFQAQLHYPAEVVVKSAVVRLGNSSFDLRAEVWAHGRCCATSKAVMVWMDATSKRPMRIPAPALAMIRDYEGIG